MSLRFLSADDIIGLNRLAGCGGDIINAAALADAVRLAEQRDPGRLSAQCRALAHAIAVGRPFMARNEVTAEFAVRRFLEINAVEIPDTQVPALRNLIGGLAAGALTTPGTFEQELDRLCRWLR